MLQKIDLPDSDVNLFLLRIDQIHPTISGNKFFKLKYNLEEAKTLGYKTLLTFGGAYSNHIAATAAAGKEFGLNTIGIVRGEELDTTNHTLTEAKKNGMKFHFVSREDYKKKEDPLFIDGLKKMFGDFYLVPEGGSNALAVKGCAEIVNYIDVDFNHICCAVGTGGTLAGITCSLQEHQTALGFSSLKGGDFLEKAVNDLIHSYIGKPLSNERFSIVTDFHFGGYAKTTAELITFKKKFQHDHHVELDYIYTAKMMFGLLQLINANYFKPGATIVAVHTGGQQGNKGFE